VAASLGEQADLQLPPLLLPGVLLTGGAVSYDRKVYQKFGGLSVASATSRQEIVSDRVGIVLRAVSVQTGEVLETVYVSKEVRSRANGVNGLSIINLDVFAAEFGSAENEPVSLAVRMAIASAVIEMVKLGVGRGWWKVETTKAADAEIVEAAKTP
jgi:curli production assembly/transport component CsgG